MRRLLAVALLLSACGGSDPAKSGDDTQTGDAPKSGDAGPPINGTDGGQPPLTGTKYTLQWGPVTVNPHVEDTQCVVLQLSNDTDIKVHQLHNTLSQGSHHLIVYRDNDANDAAGKPTPFACQPFTGALNTSGMIAPMMITQKQDDPLTLPNGVAYTLKAHQMIKLEMHYINSGDDPIQVQGNVEFYAADPATINNEADLLFIGTPDIKLPANMMTTVNEFFTPSRANIDLSSSKFFAITGHTHKLGIDMEVGLAATKGSTPNMIYQPNPFMWAEPLTASFSGNEFEVPQGTGFNFSCKYYNNTANQVQFGESANDEMCFFWAYYYPSQGAHVCVHSDSYGNIDVCCPNANPNDSICAFIASKF